MLILVELLRILNCFLEQLPGISFGINLCRDWEVIPFSAILERFYTVFSSGSLRLPPGRGSS